MRIAVLSNTPDQTSGAGRVARVLANAFEQRGNDVRLWHAPPDFFRLKRFGPLRRLVFHLRDLFPNANIANDIIAWKPDVLFTHNLTGCGFGTPRRIHRAGVRWVHMLHDVQLFEPSGRILSGERWGLFRRVWRWKWSLMRRCVMGKPDAVVSPTAWLLDLHRSHGWFYGLLSRVIPNPLLLPEIHDTSLVRDPKQLLFVGRLDPDKGIDVLLTAWNRIRHLASRLVLIGDGERAEMIRAMNDAQIDYRGAQNSEQVMRAMCESGVVVVPSLVMENQPTVILEALAADSRVVASDVGGVRETLGDAGWIVEPGSVDSLAQGIRSAFLEAEQKGRANAREEILRRHDPESSVDGFLGLFKSNA